MKKIFLLSALLAASVLFSGSSCNGATARNAAQQAGGADDSLYAPTDDKQNTKIQVAILLDTSGSMEGLIEQAKSRLWNIVNTLTTLRYKGKTPKIEIALYEYGNNGIDNDEYIRMVAPLTTDLDLISQRLFALTTWGGDEYCGAVIDWAVRDLGWGGNPADMKLIYIAGNEPFVQGRTNYKTAITRALEKNIYIHTIHCGDAREGIDGMWRDGAVRGRGQFFNIDHNQRVSHIDTPYDTQISEYNTRLNDTYISYGHVGEEMKTRQSLQDENAKSVSRANFTERAVSKSKAVYENESWDLVDKLKKSPEALAEMEISELPAEFRGKSEAEIKAEITRKEAERTSIQKEIEVLARKRQAYIEEELKKEGDPGDDLGRAINQSVIELAKEQGYTIATK